MTNKRLIARLDIKMNDLIKGVRMEGWRKFGNPIDNAKSYYQDGIDELILLDVVASLYERNNLIDIVERIAEEIHIPICVGGGVRSSKDVSELLKVGADKVTLNTAATKDFNIIREISDTFGSQATVVCMECKRVKAEEPEWEMLTDNGRNLTGINAKEWIEKAQQLGAGEIYLASIDQDGTALGCDKELFKCLSRMVDIPVIGGCGVGHTQHVVEAFKESDIEAISMGFALHKKLLSLNELRKILNNEEIKVR